MTKKRFKAIDENIWQGNEIWCVAGGKHCADVIATAMNEIINENEQLQQYIYDNLGEDICDVCSYQYLEKLDEYYVAKCKKGYDNCSKGTVIHCKDFKFKEL